MQVAFLDERAAAMRRRFAAGAPVMMLGGAALVAVDLGASDVRASDVRASDVRASDVRASGLGPAVSCADGETSNPSVCA